MLLLPVVLVDVISFTPAMRPSRRSSGVATLDAMVSGLAPGRDADTAMVGESTLGSGAPGSRKKLMTPASATPSVTSVVAIGRWTKGSQKFTPRPPAATA